MHIDFHEQQVPDASTLLKFRHMLETNKLGEKLSADVNSRLDKTGVAVKNEVESEKFFLIISVSYTHLTHGP